MDGINLPHLYWRTSDAPLSQDLHVVLSSSSPFERTRNHPFSQQPLSYCLISPWRKTPQFLFLPENQFPLSHLLPSSLSLLRSFFNRDDSQRQRLSEIWIKDGSSLKTVCNWYKRLVHGIHFVSIFHMTPKQWLSEKVLNKQYDHNSNMINMINSVMIIITKGRGEREFLIIHPFHFSVLHRGGNFEKKPL